MIEAFVCPSCLCSLGPSLDRDDWFICMACDLIAPLWYLRLMGIHECERDDYVPAFERLVSTPIVLADGREYGRSRDPRDYVDIGYDIRAGKYV